MFRRFTIVATLAVLATGFTVEAFSSSAATKTQAEKAGWDCSPDISIGGYFHCAPPGKPSLLDLIEGRAAPPTLQLRAYDDQTERFAGVESLMRADVFENGSDRERSCPQDPPGTWAFLEFEGADYYACHRYDT